MKLLPIDIILVIIIILLLFIIYYFSSKLNDDSRIYNRNSILTQICRKDHNIDNNPNYTFRLLLNEKLYVKEFNQKNFPDMNYAKNLFIFEDPNYLYQIQNKLPEKYVVKYSTGTGTNIIVDTQIQIKDIVNKCEVILKDIKDTYNHPKDSKTYLIISKIRKQQFFIEEYMGNDLMDYKFYMVNGNFIFLLIMGNRYADVKGVEKGSKEGENGHVVYYNTYDDIGKESKKIYSAGKTQQYKNPPYPLPKNYEKMKDICKRFYEKTKINFVRIDFYEIDGEMYFGEYTLIPNLCVHKLNTQYEKYLVDKYNLQV